MQACIRIFEIFNIEDELFDFCGTRAHQELFLKNMLKPSAVRFYLKKRGKDCSGGGHKARRSEAFLHTKKMFYDILCPVSADECFF